MPQAKKTSDIASHSAKVEAKRGPANRKRAIKDKTFESLTNPEKDKLLKALGIKFGLIVESAD